MDEGNDFTSPEGLVKKVNVLKALKQKKLSASLKPAKQQQYALQEVEVLKKRPTVLNPLAPKGWYQI